MQTRPNDALAKVFPISAVYGKKSRHPELANAGLAGPGATMVYEGGRRLVSGGVTLTHFNSMFPRPSVIQVSDGYVAQSTYDPVTGISHTCVAKP